MLSLRLQTFFRTSSCKKKIKSCSKLQYLSPGKNVWSHRGWKSRFSGAFSSDFSSSKLFRAVCGLKCFWLKVKIYYFTDYWWLPFQFLADRHFGQGPCLRAAFFRKYRKKSENKASIKLIKLDASVQNAVGRITGCACLRHSVLIWFTLLEWCTRLEIMCLMRKLWARTAWMHYFSAPYVKRAHLWRSGAAQINPCTFHDCFL